MAPPRFGNVGNSAAVTIANSFIWGMTMNGYRPLLKHLAQEVQLDDEIAALETLTVLANSWQELAKSEPFRDISSVETLVNTFALQIDSQKIEDAFTNAGLKDAYTPAKACPSSEHSAQLAG